MLRSIHAACIPASAPLKRGSQSSLLQARPQTFPHLMRKPRFSKASKHGIRSISASGLRTHSPTKSRHSFESIITVRIPGVNLGYKAPMLCPPLAVYFRPGKPGRKYTARGGRMKNTMIRIFQNKNAGYPRCDFLSKGERATARKTGKVSFFFQHVLEKLHNFTSNRSFRNLLQKKYIHTFSYFYVQYIKKLKENII